MKKILSILLALSFGCSPCFAYPGSQHNPVQDVGSVSTGTITTVIVTTTPVLAYSTGTYTDNLFASTSATWGQFMPDRVNIEFFNNTSTDVWIGYERTLSTQAQDNSVSFSSYSRQLPPQTAWSHSGSIKDYWVVCATTTLRKFVTTQEK